MKKVLEFLKEYKKESILAPLFKLFEALLELFVPLVMAAIIDKGIVENDKEYIIKLGVLLILLGLVGLSASITAQFFAAKAAVGVSSKLRRAMFEHIESFSFSSIDKVGTSTLITRLTSDINQVQNGINMVLRLFLRSPFIVAGAMIMAFTIDAKAAMIFLLIIPALSIVVFGIMKITIPLYKKVQFLLDGLLKDTRENILGARVIRAFNKEDSEIENFDNDNENLRSMQILVGKISGLMNPLTYVIVNGGIMFLIWKGARFVDNGTLTQGQVIALINYMSQILVELVKLANLIVTVTKAVACANRVSDIFEIEKNSSFGDELKVNQRTASKDDWSQKDVPIIEFDHVSMTYEGAADESLTDIHFSVNRGQTIGIIGPTGSGKSSLVHLIPAFYDVTKGDLRINGTSVKKWDKISLREGIGIVLQKAVLFKGTLRENLKWGSADISDEDMWQFLNISQSKEFVEGKEGKLDMAISQNGRNLSGGQRQRITIARALARKPKILILDDSSSALDFATDARLRKEINQLSDMTVFIVSQRTSSIMQADKIVVLEDGKMVGVGTHSELLETCELYKEIHNTQVAQ